MRSRRSVQSKMGIPSVGDIFDLSTSNSYPTTYQVLLVIWDPSETLVIFQLYDNETNKNTWNMKIDSQGNKEILDISGQYIISEFRKPPISSKNPPISPVQYEEVSSQNPDFLQNVPNEMLGEIIESLDAKSLNNFCQTSKRIRELCNNEDFWRGLLNRKFPDRIQFGSSKLGFRKYYYWLLDASEGKIKPHPDREISPIFDFKEGQIIKFPPFHSYKIIEFDRFGYYPNYVLRVMDLKDKSEKIITIYKEENKKEDNQKDIKKDINMKIKVEGRYPYEQINMDYIDFARDNSEIIPMLKSDTLPLKNSVLRFGSLNFTYPINGRKIIVIIKSNGLIFPILPKSSNLSDQETKILKKVGYDLYRSFPEFFGFYQKWKNMK